MHQSNKLFEKRETGGRTVWHGYRWELSEELFTVLFIAYWSKKYLVFWVICRLWIATLDARRYRCTRNQPNCSHKEKAKWKVRRACTNQTNSLKTEKLGGEQYDTAIGGSHNHRRYSQAFSLSCIDPNKILGFLSYSICRLWIAPLGNRRYSCTRNQPNCSHKVTVKWKVRRAPIKQTVQRKRNWGTNSMTLL